MKSDKELEVKYKTYTDPSLEMDNQIMGIENAKLRQQLAEKDKNFKIKEMEILDEGVEIGKEKATSDILEKIEKVLNDRSNFYYDKEDWEQTYLPFIREIEIIKQKIQGVKGE